MELKAEQGPFYMWVWEQWTKLLLEGSLGPFPGVWATPGGGPGDLRWWTLVLPIQKDYNYLDGEP